MPFDLFFTAKQKDEFHEKHERARAYAKAYQLAKFVAPLRKKDRETAILHRLDSNPETLALRALAKGGKGTVLQSNHGAGGKCITGFKKPKKIWDEKKR